MASRSMGGGASSDVQPSEIRSLRHAALPYGGAGDGADGDAHEAVNLPRAGVPPWGETVRGRHAPGHLMNAVPGLRFAVQLGPDRVPSGDQRWRSGART